MLDFEASDYRLLVPHRRLYSSLVSVKICRRRAEKGIPVWFVYSYFDSTFRTLFMYVSIIVPMFNEESTIDEMLSSVSTLLRENTFDFEVVCINDGSKDATLDVLKRCKADYPELRIINLSRNFGKENALTAGIDVAKGDVVIPMDADLQDPPELILQMIERHKMGYDVVLAKRADRSTDGKMKRLTASFFYNIIGKISHIEIPENVGDYRLMSRRVVDTLRQLNETQRFMKGVFAWPGFPTSVIEYERPERVAGETSFNWSSLTNLAIEGITSFSVAPLRLASLAGILVSFIAFLYALFILVKTVIYENEY